MEIGSDRVYRFPLSRPLLWERLCSVEDYPTWWPWLRRFEARALAVGEVWDCTVRPPLPYYLRCSVRIGLATAPELIEAELNGDLSGTARLELRAIGGAPPATEVRLVTKLAAASRAVRVASQALPSLARWGHDWVLDTAARQFTAALTRPE